MPRILTTPRLYLRRFTEADTALVLALNSRPEVTQYLHEQLLQTEADALRIIQQHLLPQYAHNLGRWAVFLNDTHQFIGWCGLKYRPELDEIDLGYRFLPEQWGKGYATEAAQYTLQYALQELRLKTVTARAHIENTASLKVLEKIGMQYLKDEVVDDCPVKTFVAVNADV
ncbi:MAG TPA: GNAT family N-acetyltransferase [Ferruginibacter sp.]|nr:GNAT family N-acetyltransferase [Ferruginibacter sp.]HMP19727.1 GNAT family N-acetyltransferase [Ferruginibacter sp.]